MNFATESRAKTVIAIVTILTIITVMAIVTVLAIETNMVIVIVLAIKTDIYLSKIEQSMEYKEQHLR